MQWTAAALFAAPEYLERREIRLLMDMLIEVPGDQPGVVAAEDQADGNGSGPLLAVEQLSAAHDRHGAERSDPTSPMTPGNRKLRSACYAQVREGTARRVDLGRPSRRRI